MAHCTAASLGEIVVVYLFAHFDFTLPQDLTGLKS